MPKDAEVNYVHAEKNYADLLNKETKAAAEWKENWGFLAGKPLPPARGFTKLQAKYTYGGRYWTLSEVRVPDETPQGMAAAEAERNFTMRKRTLTYQTKVPTEVKPCEAKGYYKGMTLVESDTSGVKNREAALLMRTHRYNSLGDACLTSGLDPTDKYRYPVSMAQEVGWRARTPVGNGRPGLEMFGVSEHGIKGTLGKMMGL